MSSEDGLLAEAWRNLGGDPARLGDVRGSSLPPLPAALPVARLVHDAIAAAALAARELVGLSAPIVVDPVRAATAVTSERWFRQDGRAQQAWHPLSGFRRSGDGVVRTHANYPHHRERLLRSLGLPGSADAADLDARIRSMTAADVEQAAAAHGALAVAVRTEGEWAASPQGRAGAEGPLLRFERRDARLRWQRGARGTEARRADDPSRASDPRRHRYLAAPSITGVPRTADAPLAGLRVLDLTRVIAGPVAGRTLALLGAEVLRIDPPQPPEIGWQHLDTGHGKCSALLDLRSVDGAERFEQLLGGADVLLLGYRPGAIDADAIAARHPALVVAELSAWGWSGPWAGRRGFDSLAQAASGIAVHEGTADAPGALPAQALDHATGYLLAAAVLRAVADGRSVRIRASLARTAAALLQLPQGAGAEPAASRRLAPTSAAADAAAGSGAAAAAAPAAAAPAHGFDPSLAHLDGLVTAQPAFGPRAWPAPPRPWGGDSAAWRTVPK